MQNWKDEVLKEFDRRIEDVVPALDSAARKLARKYFFLGAEWQKERGDLIADLQAAYMKEYQQIIKIVIDAGMVSGNEDPLWLEAVEKANYCLRAYSED